MKALCDYECKLGLRKQSKSFWLFEPHCLCLDEMKNHSCVTKYHNVRSVLGNFRKLNISTVAVSV